MPIRQERRTDDKNHARQDAKIDSNENTQATFRKLLTAWMIIFTLVVGYMINYNRDLAEDGKEAHDGICALKGDYQRMNRDAAAFLLKYPDGLPSIPPEIIRNSIRGRANTIAALEAVTCTKEEKAK